MNTAPWVLLAADYSQVELRILAHLSGDEKLAEAFREGRDIHASTASIVFGVAPEDVDRTMRSQAKAVNFGLLYGMGPQRLARRPGSPSSRRATSSTATSPPSRACEAGSTASWRAPVRTATSRRSWAAAGRCPT